MVGAGFLIVVAAVVVAEEPPTSHDTHTATQVATRQAYPSLASLKTMDSAHSNAEHKAPHKRLLNQLRRLHRRKYARLQHKLKSAGALELSKFLKNVARVTQRRARRIVHAAHRHKHAKKLLRSLMRATETHASAGAVRKAISHMVHKRKVQKLRRHKLHSLLRGHTHAARVKPRRNEEEYQRHLEHMSLRQLQHEEARTVAMLHKAQQRA